MKIETKFDMGQTVYVTHAGGKQVRVVGIKLAGRNLIYEVEFWADDGSRMANVYEDELTENLGDFLKKSGFNANNHAP